MGFVSPVRVGVGLRCWAGRIAKCPLVVTGLIVASLVTASIFLPMGHGVGAVHPESISALFRIQYCDPSKRGTVKVGSKVKSLAVMRNLSVL